MSDLEGASKTGEAVVVSMYPDVCIKDGKPVPYDLYGLASDDLRHSANVRYTRKWTLNEGARLSTCYGDEPASAGVSSGVVQGMCRPVSDFASSVNVNGLRAVRHDTVFEMNCAGPEGPSNTQGKLVYVVDQSESVPDDEFERRRRATLERLRQHYGEPDFYKQLSEFDSQNASRWDLMADFQEKFRAAEPDYVDAARAYSESMRETLHQSMINLFEDGPALHSITQNSSTGLYDWLIQIHPTAFYENGAFNADFIPLGIGVLLHADPRIISNVPQFIQGTPTTDPYAERAAAQVRANRAQRGLRVSQPPGQALPETKRVTEEYKRMLEIWGVPTVIDGILHR